MIKSNLGKYILLASINCHWWSFSFIIELKYQLPIYQAEYNWFQQQNLLKLVKCEQMLTEDTLSTCKCLHDTMYAEKVYNEILKILLFFFCYENISFTKNLIEGTINNWNEREPIQKLFCDFCRFLVGVCLVSSVQVEVPGFFA